MLHRLWESFPSSVEAHRTISCKRPSGKAKLP